jgi:hypothetical protein
MFTLTSKWCVQKLEVHAVVGTADCSDRVKSAEVIVYIAMATTCGREQ